LWIALPESVRFLLLRDASDPRINVIVEKLAGMPAGAARFFIGEEQHETFTVVQLFTHRRAIATVLLWVVFFMNLRLPRANLNVHDRTWFQARNIRDCCG
jgi:AAHS family 4-hydroxybenzoate transporter-like MFS transporter